MLAAACILVSSGGHALHIFQSIQARAVAPAFCKHLGCLAASAVLVRGRSTSSRLQWQQNQVAEPVVAVQSAGLLQAVLQGTLSYLNVHTVTAVACCCCVVVRLLQAALRL
jgi:ketopantoate hydroxymethyltransferase